LPPKPKIFHGRDTELSDILNLFIGNTPRVAILGPGGIGKTSLARAVLHHPQIKAKFDPNHYFVACDPASTTMELVSLIGSHLGLKAGKNMSHSVIHFFSTSPSCLLILDNLETVWEPSTTRGDIEEFLSLL
ncbi:P-loop containing nucleoside triphosphate hydrolase protein, partial [Mycena crocata]